VHKTTAQTFVSNGSQCNEWHIALLRVSKREETLYKLKIILTRQFLVFRFSSLRDLFHGFPDDDSLGIEICSSAECHLLK